MACPPGTKFKVFLSIYPAGKGLFPHDTARGTDAKYLIADDINFSRILNGQDVGAATSATLDPDRQLTASQTYYWGVEATMPNGTHLYRSAKFETAAPAVPAGQFSEVTLITHGFSIPYWDSAVGKNFIELADLIAKSDGAVLEYQPATGVWLSLNHRPVALGKPLVLISNWVKDSAISDSGFSEAAADALFAGLVQLDRTPGLVLGASGAGVPAGAVFASPVHLIGFSRGTVVTGEIAQRFGPYFPGVDLQMTTLDPHDFPQESLDVPLADVARAVKIVGDVLGEFAEATVFKLLTEAMSQGGKIVADAARTYGLDPVLYSDFKDPRVQVWGSVAFADNYYQAVANPAAFNAGRTIRSFTPNGRSVEQADIDLKLTGRAGFTEDDFIIGIGSAHQRVKNWYAGTVSLDLTQFPAGDEKLFRRTEDRDKTKKFYDNPNPWYASQESRTPPGFAHGDTKGPWEGIGEGFFYSQGGGGVALRPASKLPRTSVAVDNTEYGRGDRAVPTVFDGNFQASIRPVVGRFPIQYEIPGWSFHGGSAGTDDGLPLVGEDAGKYAGLHLVGLMPVADARALLTALDRNPGDTGPTFLGGQYASLNRLLNLGGPLGPITRVPLTDKGLTLLKADQSAEKFQYALELKGFAAVAGTDTGTPLAALTKATQDRMYVAPSPQTVRFDTYVIDGGFGDELRATFLLDDGTVVSVGSVPVAAAGTGFQTASFTLSAADAGKVGGAVVRLQFELVGALGAPVTTRVLIDNIVVSDGGLAIITDDSGLANDSAVFFTAGAPVPGPPVPAPAPVPAPVPAPGIPPAGLLAGGRTHKVTVSNPHPGPITITSLRVNTNDFVSRISDPNGGPDIVLDNTRMADGMPTRLPFKNLLPSPVAIAPGAWVTFTVTAGLAPDYFTRLNAESGLGARMTDNQLLSGRMSFVIQMAGSSTPATQEDELFDLVDDGDARPGDGFLEIGRTLVDHKRDVTIDNPARMLVQIRGGSPAEFTEAASDPHDLTISRHTVSFTPTAAGTKAANLDFVHKGVTIYTTTLAAEGQLQQTVALPLDDPGATKSILTALQPYQNAASAEVADSLGQMAGLYKRFQDIFPNALTGGSTDTAWAAFRTGFEAAEQNIYGDLIHEGSVVFYNSDTKGLNPILVKNQPLNPAAEDPFPPFPVPTPPV